MSGQEIIEAETRWAQAILDRQGERLKALMHPNFVFLDLKTAGTASWSRADWLASVKAIRFSALEHKVRDLQVFGAAAVATVDGRWTAEATGRSYEELVVMTDVWTRAPGGLWRVVRRHATRYAEDAATHQPRDVPPLILEL